MLIRFIVKNFNSFKEETEFNMFTSKSKKYQKHSNHILKTSSGVELVKTAAIYGANASGKSNLIDAILNFKNIALNHKENSSLIPLSKRFKIDKSYKNLPTSFRIETTFNGNHFDYGIEINKGKVSEEWLFLIKDVKKEQEELLFERKDNEISFGIFFKENQISYLKQFLTKELKRNESVLGLSEGRVEENNIIDDFITSLNNLIIISPESYNTSYFSSMLTGELASDFASEILREAETGIENIVIEKLNADNFFSYEETDRKEHLIERLEESAESANVKEEDVLLTFGYRGAYHSFSKENKDFYVSILKTKHFQSSELFDLEEESDGTNRLLELTPAIDDLLNNKDFVYIIDELERSLHPILAKRIVKLFSESQTKNSQLIFTTHETHLLDLDIFRQDEIWFSEKKTDGSSEFYPLSKFKPREDKDIRKGYLQGRYGGIPYLGDFSKIEENV